MTLEIWSIFVLASIIPVISPGPAILLAIRNTLQQGVKATLFSALGNSIGLVVLGIAIAFGLGSIMAVSVTLFTIFKLVGASYLVYLGIKVWRDCSMFSNNTDAIVRSTSSMRLCMEAFLVAVTNPKPIFVLAAIFPQFLSENFPLMPQVLILSMTYSALCFLNHLLLATFAGRIQYFLQSEKRSKVLRRLVGGSFIGFGGVLAATPH